MWGTTIVGWAEVAVLCARCFLAANALPGIATAREAVQATKPAVRRVRVPFMRPESANRPKPSSRGLTLTRGLGDDQQEVGAILDVVEAEPGVEPAGPVVRIGEGEDRAGVGRHELQRVGDDPPGQAAPAEP